MTGEIHIADLFCGAGGTSTGAIEAIEATGGTPILTAINHWDVAIATHKENHPAARHLCTGVDSINPRDLYRPGQLQLLWGSPECTHHSNAAAGKPKNEQSRATAMCLIRWAEALQPDTILVENVPEFINWGPLDSRGHPLRARRGEIFRAWVGMLEAIGYRVGTRVLRAADYGDPTTRRRLFVQAVRGRRRIIWPDPTHAPVEGGDLFGARAAWCGADRHVIDWSIPIPSVAGRRRPLSANTVARINEGLLEYGSPLIIAMEHGGRVIPASRPLPTVTTAKGGAFGLAYLLPQHGGGKLRPATQPAPTVTTDGAIGLVVEYYGNGGTVPVSQPLPTVTCKDRFGLVRVADHDIGFRMLQWPELAAAQGFRRDHKFTGTKTEIVKQIGNAVPRRLARAIVAAALTQSSDVAWLADSEPKATAA